MRVALTARVVLFLAAMAIAVPAQAQIDAGRAAYVKAECEICHGPGGNGAGQGPALVPFTKDLQELTAIIRQGVGLMPGISRDMASDAEISQILAYLKSLGNGPVPAASLAAAPDASASELSQLMARLDRARLASDFNALATTGDALRGLAARTTDAAAQHAAQVAAAYAIWARMVQSPAPPPQSSVLVSHAIEDVQRAIPFNDRAADDYAFLAMLYALQQSMTTSPSSQDASRIVAALDRAKSLDASGPVVLFLSGITAVLAPGVAGDRASAAEQLRRAEQLLIAQPPSGSLWRAADAAIWLGRALAQRGDAAGARQAYERAAKLQPDYVWLNRVLLPALQR